MDKWFRLDTPVEERDTALVMERRVSQPVRADRMQVDVPAAVTDNRIHSDWTTQHPRCCE